MERVPEQSSNRRQRWGFVIALAAALAAPAITEAAHPLATDDAGTLGRGVRQAELTAELSRDSEGPRAERTSADAGEGGVAVGYGLLDRLDLVVGVATSWSRVQQRNGPVSEARGLGDLALDLKWRALEVGGFALALKPGITLPTGDADRGLGAGRPCYALTLVASQELGPVALHANVAYLRDDYDNREAREASRLDRLQLSVALAAQVAERLQVVADVGAESNADVASATWPAYALGGVIYAASDDVELDLGVRVGLSAPEADVAGLLGATFRF
jgi:hypothetical protein